MSTHVTTEGKLLWKPTQKQIDASNLTKLFNYLQVNHNLHFHSYHDLWQWSVDEPETFWAVLWEYFDIRSHTPYKRVLSNKEMPGSTWFDGSTLNFAEYVFRMKQNTPALFFKSEQHYTKAVSWNELEKETASIANWLKNCGVEKGDRVAAFIPNIPQAFSGMLATASIGAVWSSCSPDFGIDSVADRFAQIEPKVLIAVNGYFYNGKKFDKVETVNSLLTKLPTVEQVLLINYTNEKNLAAQLTSIERPITIFDELGIDESRLTFEPVPFNHPLWVLYSSGTTGLPKPIVHGHGGMLLEHLKYMEFHADVKPGDRFFWFSTTGWMMWNVVLAALLRGASAVVYDGSPAYPSISALWEFAEETKMTHFGTSASFIINCMKNEMKPKDDFDLSSLRVVGSTGSPLPPEGFKWVYENIGKDIVLNSTSGGTDICSSFVGGNPILPVYSGEIQCRILGASVKSYDEHGNELIDEVGEMVIDKPLPCMPIYFWGDAENTRYKESYFEMYPGVWRHGDWLKITPRGTCIIYGRSDATLNKMGVRIGTSEIYRAVEVFPEIKDSLIVSLEKSDGSWYMPLFVVMNDGIKLDEKLTSKIKQSIKERIAPRFIPDDIIPISEIPYTLSGKKLEKPVKRILEGKKPSEVASPDSLRNPNSLNQFVEMGLK